VEVPESSPPNRWSQIMTIGLTLGLATMVFAILSSWPLATDSVRADTVSVGLVTDDQTLADQAWNWTSYQGLQCAEAKLGVVGKVYTSTSSIDYGTNLEYCVSDSNSLCISVGYYMADVTCNLAQANPAVDFAIVDFAWNETYPDNLRGMGFAVDETGFLAGTLAGLMTESDKVGAIGGFPIPVVEGYIEGYRNGAQQANLGATVIVTYTEDFDSEDKGHQATDYLISQDVDVIFNVAGKSGSAGILHAAQQGIWVIGVDFDEYFTTFDSGSAPGADKLLTSALKELNLAVFDTISDVVSGSFTSGTVLYDLERLNDAGSAYCNGIVSENTISDYLVHSQGTNGVGLAPFHDADSSIPQNVRDGVDAVRQGIINDTIDVSFSGRLYLPVVLKNPGP
jgi:basic membrane protein A